MIRCAPSPRLAPWFADYASYNRARGNQVTHLAGIPVLMVAILGLLSRVVLVDPGVAVGVDLAGALFAPVLLWYLWLDWRLAVPFAFAAALSHAAGSRLPLAVLWSLFAAGWVVQYLGHLLFERRRPAFHRSLAHLLIGRLWVFAKLFRWKVL